jgi:O-antigen/teichoic acid export membrane protein
VCSVRIRQCLTRLGLMCTRPNQQPRGTASATSSRREEDHLRTLATGAGIALSGQLVGRMIFLATQVLLARVLGPQMFGLYAVGWAVFRVVGFLGTFGMQTAVVRFGSRYRGHDVRTLHSAIAMSLGLAMITAFAAGAALFALASPLAQQVFHREELADVFRGFALGIPLFVGMTVAAAATRIDRRMHASVITEEILQPGLTVVFLLLSYVAGAALRAAIGATVASFGVAFAVSVILLNHEQPGALSRLHLTPGLTQQLLAFAVPATLSGVVGISNFLVDRMLVGYFLTPTDVGIYQAAAQISLLFALIINVFVAAMSPMIASLYSGGERNRLADIYRTGTRWGIVLCIPLLIVICVVPEQLLAVGFGRDYVEGSGVLIVLSLGRFLQVAVGASGAFLVMTGFQGSWLAVSLLGLALNMLLGTILIPPFGTLGAAAASALAAAAMSCGGLWMVRHSLQLWPYDQRYLGIALSASVALALTLAVLQLGFQRPATALFVATLVTVLAFATLLLRIGLSAEDRVLFELLGRHGTHHRS